LSAISIRRTLSAIGKLPDRHLKFALSYPCNIRSVLKLLQCSNAQAKHLRSMQCFLSDVCRCFGQGKEGSPRSYYRRPDAKYGRDKPLDPLIKFLDRLVVYVKTYADE